MAYPGGDLKGQAGWDVGINYQSLDDLLVKLKTDTRRWLNEVGDPQPWNPLLPTTALSPEPRRLPLSATKLRTLLPRIGRLAIHCHGGPGIAYINGTGAGKARIDQTNVASFTRKLVTLSTMLTADATVLFMSCMTGQGPEGTTFLQDVSALMPGRMVVAFQTNGFAPGSNQTRAGDFCAEPGMRVTDGMWGDAIKGLTDSKYMKQWSDLNALPWAWEGARFAKAARGGKLLFTKTAKP
jgi:hypothetical protein